MKLTLVVCDLVISEALPYDPRAAKTLTDLIAQPVDISNKNNRND